MLPVAVAARATARSTNGTLFTGQSAFGRNRVSGQSLVPAPAASTTAARLSVMRIERWVNPTQPQTLQIAVFLFYFNAVLGLIFGQFAGPVGLVLLVGDVGAALGIANEYKWGYLLGVAMSLLPFVFIAILIGGGHHAQ